MLDTQAFDQSMYSTLRKCASYASSQSLKWRTNRSDDASSCDICVPLSLNTGWPSEYSALPEFLAGILHLDLDNDESHVVVLRGVGGESVGRLQDAIYHLLSR